MKLFPLLFPRYPWLAAALAGLALGSTHSQAQTINPADYGTLSLHLKAGDLALTQGTAVTNWGGLTVPAGVAGATAPTFVAADAQFSGKPAVLFTTASKNVLTKAGANFKATTIFAVTTAETSAPALAGLISTGADKLNVRRNNSVLFYRSAGQAMDANDFPGVVAGGALSVNNVVSGSYTAGVPHIVQATAGAQQVYTDFWLGGASSALARWWAGRVAEVLVYEGALTPAQTNLVGYYLQNKYNLAGNYPTPFPTITSFTGTVGALTSSQGVLSPGSGQPVTLNWTTAVTNSVSINNGTLAAPGTASGSVVVNPAVTTTYTLTAGNSFGATTATATFTVYVGVPVQHPIINEFMAENTDGLVDPSDLSHPDWIEIFNPNAFGIDLQGYRLRDAASEWDFPASSGIAANGYLLVYASGKNLRNPAAVMHTNFTLLDTGEYLGLFRISDLAVASQFSPSYPNQFKDVSYGWWAPRNGNRFFGKPTGLPTPGAANGANGVLGFLDKTDDTDFTVDRGFYTAPVTTTITAKTPGSTIIYTTDGSDPSLTNGVQTTSTSPGTPTVTLTIHSAAVPGGATGINIASIGGVTTLRAAAFKDDFARTNVDTQTYIFADTLLGQTVADANTRGWPNAAVNGQVFNYGMDANAVAAYPRQDVLDGLQSLPMISVVSDIKSWVDPAYGIYSNAVEHGSFWEQPMSVELIHPPGYVSPDGLTKGFQINAGVRIRGGFSRNDQFFKHALRFYFNKDYDGKLNYRFFGDEGTNEYSVLDLATSSNYAWYREPAYGTGSQNTMIRDMFCRDTQGAMGQPYAKSRFYHVLLNGHYWGLYYTDERPVADFGASYQGGSDNDYDAIKCGNRSVVPNFATEATDGDMVAWTDLWNKCRSIGTQNASDAKFFEIIGRNPDGTRNPALPVLLDADNLIDEMLVLFYSGDGDAVLSNFLARNTPNNWFSFYKRNGESGFKFIIHDAEHTLGAGSATPDQTGPFGGSNVGSLEFSNPQRMHQDLMSSPAYRRRFADRVQKHFFNGGALTLANCLARFDARAAVIRKAMKVEEARWGDANAITGLPGGHAARYTVADWEAALTFAKTWMQTRSQTVLEQIIADGLYPAPQPAAMADNVSGTLKHGGNVPMGFPLRLTATGGPSSVVYYTLDGTDPRPEWQGSPAVTTFLAENAAGLWHVPTSATDGFSVTTNPVVAYAFYPLDFASAPVAAGAVPDTATTAVGDGVAQNGVFVGAPTLSTNRNGTANTALTFSGAGQAITITNATQLQLTSTITLAAWVRTTTSPTNAVRNIIAKGPATSPTNGEIFLRMNGGDFEVGSWNGTNHLASVAIYNDLNAWVHLAGTYDGTAWKLYRNGQLVSTKVDPVGPVSVNAGWGIGGSSAGNSRLWTGQLDDVAIFNVALTPAQIAGLAGLNQADWAQPAATLAGTWTPSTGGVGYERDVTNTLDPAIGTDIEPSIYNIRSTLQLRKTFTLDAAQISSVTNLLLKMKYDDGYVAYLNGVEVSRRNTPALGSISGTSVASAAHADIHALQWDTQDITAKKSLLLVGTNVLALHALNLTAADEDLLINAELAATTAPLGLGGSAMVYTAPILLNNPFTVVKTRTFVDGEWSALDEAIFTNNTVPADANNLVVSQIDYNPLGTSDFEFLELMAIGTQNVDLTGVVLSAGIDYSFPTGTILAPGERVQVAGDGPSFALRHGNAPPIRLLPGKFLGSLSNSGEQIRVVADNGSTIKDFTYGTTAPWPLEADGHGYRLVLINPLTNPNHNLASNWRGSESAAYTPGQSDARRFSGDPNADADGDGLSAFTEYALGTSDTDPLAGRNQITLNPAAAGPNTDRHFSITIQRPVAADDATGAPELSYNLNAWQGGAAKFTLISSQRLDTMVEETWEVVPSFDTDGRQFIRYRVVPR